MKLATPFFTFLLLTFTLFTTACNQPKPKKNPSLQCQINAHIAPQWMCSNAYSDLQHEEKSVYGYNEKEVKEDAFVGLAKYMQVFLEQETKRNHKYLLFQSLLHEKISILQMLTLATKEATFTHSANQKTKSGKTLYYKILEIKHTLLFKYLDAILLKQTKTFQNCHATGAIASKTKCTRDITAFLSSFEKTKRQQVFIKVHTDKSGSAKGNLSISQKRAHYIAHRIYEKFPKKWQIYSAGLGETKPLITEQTKRANAINRRVEIIVLSQSNGVNTKKYVHFVPTKNVVVRNKAKVKIRPQYKKPAYARAKPITPFLMKKRTSRWNKTPSNRLHLPSGKPAPTNANIINYIGKYDTGWNPFGKKELKKKLTIRCVDDTPREMKRKSITDKSGKKKSFTKFKNGMIGKPWYITVDGYVMALSKVHLFEDMSLSLKDPFFQIYKNNKKIKELQTTVNVYKGKKGILYRIFFEKNDSFQCADLLILDKNIQAVSGQIYYVEDKKLKTVTFKPKMH